MPAQNITDTYYASDYGNVTQYTGCISNSFSFTVQTGTVLAGLLNGYPWQPLPNSNAYWSYPINANNREWYQISGDWTGTSITMPTVNSITDMRWQPYGPGPGAPHIVWTNEAREGGIIGGDYGSVSYVGTTSSPSFTSDTVMDGCVFYNILNSQPYGSAFGQFECIDEATGQIKYVANGTFSCGIHLTGSSYAQSSAAEAAQGGLVTLASSYGSFVQPFLWGSVTVNGIQYWMYYDAKTGALLKQYSNASSARLIDGTELAFGAGTLVGQTGSYVYRWNMTSVVGTDWKTGITWKKPLPTPIFDARAPSIFAVSSDSSVIVLYNYQQYWGYDAVTGASLWNLTLNYQTNANEEVPLGGGIDDFIVWNPGACYFDCYSIKTGALLFTTPSVSSSPWATQWTVYGAETNDLNNLYLSYPDGTESGYSLTDGHLLWTSTPVPSTEYSNNVVPISYGMVMMGGLLYTFGGYLSSYELDPVPRFAFTICVNVTTGDTVWILPGGIDPLSGANGYLVGGSRLDGRLYCVGKGSTSTSVTAQQQVGGSVLIQGSVLDMSSGGSSSATLKAMFPNGVPAISDDNMSVWMDYLYVQNATLLNSPPICTGVPVTLTAVDPNGNVAVIGTTTSNYQGDYGFQWTPTTPGLYTIYATFTGSNSYYTSTAATYATVAAAAATTTPAPTQTGAASNLATTTDLMTYIAVVGIAIIIVVAIGFIVLYRKK